MADAAGTPRLLRAFGASDPLADPKRVTRQGDELKVVYEKQGLFARMFGDGHAVVCLFEADAPDSNISGLIFRAKVRTQVTAKEMKLVISYGQGAKLRMSLAKDTEVSKSGEWASHEISVSIKEEKILSPIKLSLYFDGVGSVFLKDVEFLAVGTSL